MKLHGIAHCFYYLCQQKWILITKRLLIGCQRIVCIVWIGSNSHWNGNLFICWLKRKWKRNCEHCNFRQKGQCSILSIHISISGKKLDILLSSLYIKPKLVSAWKSLFESIEIGWVKKENYGEKKLCSSCLRFENTISLMTAIDEHMPFSTSQKTIYEAMKLKEAKQQRWCRRLQWKEPINWKRDIYNIAYQWMAWHIMTIIHTCLLCEK